LAASASDDANRQCVPGFHIGLNTTHQRSGDRKDHTAGDFWARFVRALLFSIETMMTIGYGVDDPWFGDCPVMLMLIAAQSMVGIFASSILFGIVLTRVSRADQRSKTIGG
jgi:hypothetical protein